MKLREAIFKDAEAVCEVHVASVRELGREAYDEAQVQAWSSGRTPEDYPIESDKCHFVVAEVDGQVRGFGELRFEPGEHLEADVDAEVRAMYVHPEVARQGVGSALLAELERAGRDAGFERLGLWASRNAVPFYESHGYEHVTEHRHEFGGEVPGRAVEMRGVL